MEPLRKKENNGVNFSDSMTPCDICAISKSRQLAHPKKTTRETTAPMQLAYTDSMRKITPPAKGGFGYVSKLTDAYSRMKEIYLLKAKFETVRALRAYNMKVAVPLGRRIEIIRCDRGGKTSSTSSPRTAWTQASPSNTPRPTRLSRIACPSETGKP
ncbi:unnamed protein product [Ectocarpus sp. 4 AP-2014]